MDKFLASIEQSKKSRSTLQQTVRPIAPDVSRYARTKCCESLQAANAERAVAGRIDYGPGRSGGEVIFVPRRQARNKQHGAWHGHSVEDRSDDKLWVARCYHAAECTLQNQNKQKL